jgi:catalase
MDGVPDQIIDRQLAHFDQISKEYGDGVRAARAALKTAKPADSISDTESAAAE